MMMNKSLIVSLLLLTIQWTGINASLRSGSEHDVEMNGDVHHHQRSRELWGTGRQWSFSNLLFHIGICSADTGCTDKPRPGPLGCGCPDCNKPHPPHFQHNYCENLNSTSSSEAEAAVDSSQNKEATTNGTQTATSMFNPVALMAAAAVMAFLIAGIIMQKRRQSQSADERAIPLDGDKDENNSTSGISTAFAAVMTRMGLKAGDKTDSDNDYDDMDDNGSVHSVKNAVLNRQSLAASGVAVPPIYQMESTPSFIPIPQDPTNPYVSQTREGLEVGGYRPSSVRNSSDFRASTPYAV